MSSPEEKRLINGGNTDFFNQSTERVGVSDDPTSSAPTGSAPAVNTSAVNTSASATSVPVAETNVDVIIKAVATPDKKLVLKTLEFADQPAIILEFKETGLEPDAETQKSAPEATYAKARVSGLSVDNNMRTTLQKISNLASSAGRTTIDAAGNAVEYAVAKQQQYGIIPNIRKMLSKSDTPNTSGTVVPAEKKKKDGGVTRRRRNKKTVSRRRRASRRR